MCSYPDEAEVDHDAEITTEKVEEIEANHDEDGDEELFTASVSSTKKDEMIE